MLFLETLPMAWKLRETTFFQAAAYEPAPAVPRLATVLPRTEVRFAHRVKPGLKRRQKAEGRRQKERNVGLVRGSVSPSSAVRKSKPEKLW